MVAVLGKLKKPLIITLTIIILSLMVGQAFATGENIVINGGCENGLFNWLPTPGYTQNEQSGITYHTGTRAFLDSNLDGFIGNSMYQEYPAGYNTSKIAYISLWAIVTDDTGNMLVQVSVFSDSTGESVVYNNSTFRATTWTFINITSGWPANETLTSLSWTISCQSNGKVLIDDIAMYVDTSSGGSTPAAYTDPGVWGGTIDKFTGFILPLVILLIPSALLAAMTHHLDKWTLLIGLVIGAGLGVYFALVPVWVLFLIVIGLVGMAYQSVRGGG